MNDPRIGVVCRATVCAPLVVLAATILFSSTGLIAGTVDPLSFDPRNGLAPMEDVALKEMDPVDAAALRAEDTADAANRSRLAAWLEAGGPMPAVLMYELTDGNRQLFGDWLLSGGPIPASVLQSLPAASRQALTGAELSPSSPVPNALLEQLSGLMDLLHKTERVGLAMAAWTSGERPMSLSPASSGTWENLPAGGRVWRLRVRSADARWLVLGFRTFRPLTGARMHIYDRDLETILGPFTTGDIREHRQLWTPPIDGDEVVVELFWPEGLRGVAPDIVLSTVSHGYKNAWYPEDELVADDAGFDPSVAGSGSCNVDINCEPTWHKERDGIIHLLFQGSSWCSASLVNNTAEDCTHYVLTAAHCINTASEAAATGFRFNYEREGCSSGGTTVSHVRTGSFLRATRSTTDFTLLEMDDPIPAEWEAYFNGWSRANTPAPEATCLHHPSGDDKKISFEFDPLILGVAYGPSHWRVRDWDSGTTEGGSSGSPLFDTTNAVSDTPHIIGQLSGGQAACSNNSWDEYGRFDLSWTGGASTSSRLREWLDPLGTDPQTFGGKAHSVCLNPFPDFAVQDAFVQDYRGNGDDYPDPGEAIELQLTLLNIGNSEATLVTGELTTSAENVVIPNPVATWPNIEPGESGSSDAPHFDVQIDPAYPCAGLNQVLPMTLEVDNAQSFGSVVVNFDLQLGAPVPTSVFEDDLEPTFAPGWIYFSPSGAGWGLNDSEDPEDSTSPTRAWFVENSDEAGVSPLTMPTQPPGGGPLGPRARLRFQHRFLTEEDTDGGVLEYSLNGTEWHDITHDLSTGLPKNRFLANAYNGTITALDGRAAWEGASGGWMQVEVDLSDFEGETLRLRYLFASDDGNVGPVEGWFLDDVVVEYIDFACDPLAEAPGTISELRLGRTPTGDVTFEWQPPAPSDGGAILGYVLQETSLGPLDPQYVLELGAVPTAEVDAALLGDASGFLVVGRNTLGMGSTGTDSEGAPRPPAQPAP
jgi:hypothetical protein